MSGGKSSPIVGGLLCAISLLTGPALAAESGVPQEQPPIRVTSELVLLDLVILDKAGKPVRDLRKDELEVREGSQKRKIQFLQRIDGHQTEVAAGSEAPDPAAAAQREGGAAGSRMATPTAILVDLESSDVDASIRTRQAIKQFVETQIDERDPILFAYIKDGLGIAHNFTRDRDETLRALESLPQAKETIEFNRLSQRLSRLFLSARGCPFCDPLSDAMGMARDHLYEVENRARSSFSALSSLAGYLVRLPGRKQLVLFSAGYPLNYRVEVLELIDDYSKLHPSRGCLLSPGETSVYPILNASLGGTGNWLVREIRKVVDNLNSAQCSVYAIDPRGLMTLNLADGGLGRVDPTAASKHARRSIVSPLEFNDHLAAETGGLSINQTNDLGRGLAEAQRDSHSYYLAAFRPSKRDGKQRKIEVKIDRKGLTVRHRKHISPSSLISDRVLTAFSFPGLFSEFPLKVATQISREVLHLTVSVGTDALVFAKTGGFRNCALEVFAGLQNEKGLWVNEKPDVSRRYDIKLNQQEWVALMDKDTVEAPAEMKLLPGQYRLVVVVRQRPSGVISAWSGPLSVSADER